MILTKNISSVITMKHDNFFKNDLKFLEKVLRC